MTVPGPMGPPGAFQPRSSPMPARRPRRRIPGWLLAIVFLAIPALAGFAVVRATLGAFDSRQGRDTAAADRKHDPRPKVDSDEDLPRYRQVEELRDYCDEPGQAWKEAPPYRPDGAASAFVWDQGVARSSGFQAGDGGESPWFAGGGLVVVGPQEDLRFQDGATASADTSVVVCLRTIGAEGAGQTCTYEETGGYVTPVFGGKRYRLDLQRYKYEVIAYELRTGTILTLGDLYTPSTGCPDRLDLDDTKHPFTFQLRQDDVLKWVGAHFPAKRPS